MKVKSVEIVDVPPRGTKQATPGIWLGDGHCVFDMSEGGRYLVCRIADLDPPKERKECARVERPEVGVGLYEYLCERCTHLVDATTTYCSCCNSHLTHTISWEKFTKRDC